jgi:hypothetical protein
MMPTNWKQDEKLPFPTRLIESSSGIIEEYIIPDEMKQEVLNQLYPFAEPPPSIDEELYDLHEGKLFKVKDYMVVWERGFNFLVSPYYASSGGDVLDWVPADIEDEEEEEKEDC